MKNDLKSILDNLTTYFDSLFKDRITKIIILCSICALIIVGIVSFFAITSSAEEPSGVDAITPNSGLYINEFRIYPGLADFVYDNAEARSAREYGFLLIDSHFRPFDSWGLGTVNNNKCIVFFFNQRVVKYVYNTDSVFGIWVTDFIASGTEVYDDNDNLIYDCPVSLAYNLIGYWYNPGGWSCDSSYASFTVNGQLLDENWNPSGIHFSNFDIGMDGYLPKDDYVTFYGEEGRVSVDNETPVYLRVDSVSPTSTWYENVLLSYAFSVGHGIWYYYPPDMFPIVSGYYYLVDVPPFVDQDINTYVVNIDFTAPISSDPTMVYNSIQFVPHTVTGDRTEILYTNSSVSSLVYYRYVLEGDGGSYLNQQFKYIKVENDTLVSTAEFLLFKEYFVYEPNEGPFIDYDNGFNNGYSEGLSQSFVANFFKGIIDALDQLTIFYGFSFLTIIQTVLGFCVLLWILKLIAGG